MTPDCFNAPRNPTLAALGIAVDVDNPPPVPVRVQHAIALLDSRLSGKAHALAELDLDRLDFFSVHWDVLGQLYGSTAAGLGQFGLTDAEAIAVGLDADGDEQELTDEFVRQVGAVLGTLPRRDRPAVEMAEVA